MNEPAIWLEIEGEFRQITVWQISGLYLTPKNYLMNINFKTTKTVTNVQITYKSA